MEKEHYCCVKNNIKSTKLLSINEVQEILNISLNDVYELIKSVQIIKVRRRIYIEDVSLNYIRKRLLTDC